MVKIVYNGCYGGFGLSKTAKQRYAELAGVSVKEEIYEGMMDKIYSSLLDKNGELLFDSDIERDDPFLVQVVEEMGKDANGYCADLKIREIPKGSKYIIDEYDGLETIVLENEIKWRTA